jgi:hypothetical protein
MNCSRKSETDMAFLVYTNSPTDYKVTVKSDSVDKAAEQAIELLARECESRLSRGIFDFAAVAPQVDRSDGFWAVRGFDCGRYLGRPHTLGLVAVWVPARPSRILAVWRYLAPLLPPIPGSDTYELAPPDETANPPSSALEAMRQWEERQGERVPTQAVLFGLKTTVRGIKMASQSRLPWLRTAVIVICGLAVMAGMAFWLRSAHVATQPTTHPSLTAKDKEEIVQLLQMILPPDQVDPRSTSDRLVSLVLQTEGPIGKRLSDLSADLKERLNRPETNGEMQGFLGERLKEWNKNPQTLADPPDTAVIESPDRLNAALNILRQYKKIHDDLLDPMVNRDIPESETFNGHLNQLKQML